MNTIQYNTIHFGSLQNGINGNLCINAIIQDVSIASWDVDINVGVTYL